MTDTTIKKMVVIDRMGEIEVNKNGKKFRKLTVTTLDSKQTLDLKAYLGQDDKEPAMSTGQEFLMEILCSDWKGKTYYTTLMWTIEACRDIGAGFIKDEAEAVAEAPIKVPQTQTKPADPIPQTEVDWDGKELRGHRRACLAIAAGFLTDAQKERLGQADVEICGMVQLTADKLLQYVYNETGVKEDPIYDPAAVANLPEDVQ